MYQIKQFLQDFVVNEISNVNMQENGQYAYFNLKKADYSTVRVLEILSEKLNIPLKNFGFAGNKDKIAVTEQKISIFRGSKSFENIKLIGIELKYLGNGKNPISLGDLEGNEFTITIRNLDDEEIDKIKNIQVPIIGFNFEINSIKNIKLKNIIKKIMDEEKINPRDFIVNHMPEMASEGASRNLFFELNGLRILEINSDELNQDNKKIKVNFTLPKSCYATTLIEFIFR